MDGDEVTAEVINARLVAFARGVLADCDRRTRVYGDAAIGLSGELRNEARALISEAENFPAASASLANGPSAHAEASKGQGVSA